MNENYEVIANEKILEDFVDWLPAVANHESYYVCLMARSKYMTEKVKGWSTKSDQMHCARFLVKPEDLIRRLRGLECPVGAYTRRGKDVPQEALAAYITPNPRSNKGAVTELVATLVNQISNHQYTDPVSAALTAAHRSRSRKIFTHMECDGDIFEPKDIFKYINTDAVDVLTTRGGYHVLVRHELVTDEYKRSWYQSLAQMGGADASGDMMMPIPGTYQGGYIPGFIDKRGFR